MQLKCSHGVFAVTLYRSIYCAYYYNIPFPIGELHIYFESQSMRYTKHFLYLELTQKHVENIVGYVRHNVINEEIRIC